MTQLLKAFAADQSDATAAKYGTPAGGIAIAVMLVVESVGLSVRGTFLEIKSIFSGSTTPHTQS